MRQSLGWFGIKMLLICRWLRIEKILRSYHWRRTSLMQLNRLVSRITLSPYSYRWPRTYLIPYSSLLTPEVHQEQATNFRWVTRQDHHRCPYSQTEASKDSFSWCPQNCCWLGQSYRRDSFQLVFHHEPQLLCCNPGIHHSEYLAIVVTAGPFTAINGTELHLACLDFDPFVEARYQLLYP